MSTWIVLSLCLTVAYGVQPFQDLDRPVQPFNPFRDSWTLTKRAEDPEVVEPKVTTKDLYKLIDNLVDAAREGINSTDLGEAAANIEGITIALDSTNVSEDEVKAIIQEIVTDRGIDTSYNVFEDPVSEFEDNLKASFNVLFGLEDRAKQLEDSDQPTSAVISAIRVVARSIQKIVLNFVGLVTFTDSGSGETQNQ